MDGMRRAMNSSSLLGSGPCSAAAAARRLGLPRLLCAPPHAEYAKLTSPSLVT